MKSREWYYRKLIKWIRDDCPGDRSSYDFGVYLPKFLRHLQIERNEQYETSSIILDTAWGLCRRGILRPGSKFFLEDRLPQLQSELGFSVTSFGKIWIQEDEDVFVPTEPERFAEMIKPFKGVFGDGYYERAQQAIRCYDAHAYLACCAMCGAAAESVLLYLAIKKMADETSVLKAYNQSGGRTKIENMIIGQSKNVIANEFRGLLSILKYWRDSASHGQARKIGDNEAFTALGMLLGFSIFVKSKETILLSQSI